MSGSYDFRNSRLWKSSLAERPNDDHQEERERLRTALVQMRARVQPLVATIQNDCAGLTVHDITHLDALWEMADLVAGEHFKLTPAEAFVFGAAVLLHDAGMAALGYPGGHQGITETIEWKDSYATFFQKKHGRSPSEEEKQSPDSKLSDQALFEALRRLHAQRAEVLAMKPIRRHRDVEFYLIEDTDLRDNYGEAIGRIAHSHHWSVDDLQLKLQGPTGAAPILPSAWKVDELKVACLLRCADVSHVDQRRAPSMLYALLQPSGYSNLHWSFQNKLRKPIQIEETLRYTAGNSFSRNEADAWWLCFEAINLIDRELSAVDALLLEVDRQRFAVRGVRGAGHPRLLAQDIKTTGWQPVAANLNVSNPIQLAQTLGGESLYGPKSFAPIRELLQNAIDAVRARRDLEEREKHWGRIELTIEKRDDESEAGVWLHIDDNGVGMSQRTLSETLLDFGRSLWTSPEVREELPGLAHRGFQAIGKFGIGFFSVFLLGQKVKVISRKFNVSNGTQVLEFESISRRPIIREANKGELPLDFSTRVSVCLDDNLVFDHSDVFRRRSRRNLLAERALTTLDDERGNTKRNALLFLGRVKSLMSCVDIRFDYNDHCNSIEFSHAPDWISQDAPSFLRELYADLPGADLDDLIANHAHRLTVIHDKIGNAVGRAAIFIPDSQDNHDRSESIKFRVSVGGVVYDADPEWSFPACGVLPGDTQYAARHHAKPYKKDLNLSSWASGQAAIFREENVTCFRKLVVARVLHYFGGDISGLPTCFLNGRLAFRDDLRNFLESNNELFIPLKTQSYRSSDEVSAYVMGLDELSLEFFLNKVNPRLCFFSIETSIRFDDEEFDQMKNDASAVFSSLSDIVDDTSRSPGREFVFKDNLIHKEVDAAWGTMLAFELQKMHLYEPPMLDMPKWNWVIRVSRIATNS
jgi:hypothetical protein